MCSFKRKEGIQHLVKMAKKKVKKAKKAVCKPC